MVRKLNVEEDSKTFEKFKKDLERFINKQEITLLDFARITEIPNKLLIYQWTNTEKFPWYFIFRCIQCFPQFFPVNHYLDVEQIHFNFERVRRLNSEKKERRLRKRNMPAKCASRRKHDNRNANRS